MDYKDAFSNFFGQITIDTIITFVMACGFMVSVYKKTQKYFIDQDKQKRASEEQMAKILSELENFAEYRKATTDMQSKMRSDIEELKTMQQDNTERIRRMEEESQKRECNRLRDTILHIYRHYTSSETNPTHTWSRMEHDNFMALFADYESLNGNGFVHSVVLPAMELLNIEEMD